MEFNYKKGINFGLWLNDVIDAFNKFDIGHAVWNYKESQFLFKYSEENKDLFEIATK